MRWRHLRQMSLVQFHPRVLVSWRTESFPLRQSLVLVIAGSTTTVVLMVIGAYGLHLYAGRVPCWVLWLPIWVAVSQVSPEMGSQQARQIKRAEHSLPLAVQWRKVLKPGGYGREQMSPEHRGRGQL